MRLWLRVTNEIKFYLEIVTSLVADLHVVHVDVDQEAQAEAEAQLQQYQYQLVEAVAAWEDMQENKWKFKVCWSKNL